MGETEIEVSCVCGQLLGCFSTSQGTGSAGGSLQRVHYSGGFLVRYIGVSSKGKPPPSGVKSWRREGKGVTHKLSSGEFFHLTLF